MANEIQELKFQVGEAWKGVYSSSTAYGLANVVQDPTGLSVYRSLKSGNVGHPLSDASWWFRIIDMSSIKAESDRIEALNQAIAQDEALRVAAEELRQQHEAARVAAETQRNEAEQARLNAEQARVNAESARATAEQQRITAEQGRVSAESARVQAEQARALSETLRANAEDQRAANEQNRIAAEQQRIERAEQDHDRAESDHAALQVYFDSLGAFDISAYHATGGVLAKYADLTAALGTNGANIPDALRKGGMSVKFVLSSDNKYVQYRLMATSFSTTEADWQGVDDEPTVGSDNLVKSRGVIEILAPYIESVHYNVKKDGVHINYNIVNGNEYYIKNNFGTSIVVCTRQSIGGPNIDRIEITGGDSLFTASGDASYLYVYSSVNGSIDVSSLSTGENLLNRIKNEVFDGTYNGNTTEQKINNGVYKNSDNERILLVSTENSLVYQTELIISSSGLFYARSRSRDAYGNWSNWADYKLGSDNNYAILQNPSSFVKPNITSSTLSIPGSCRIIWNGGRLLISGVEGYDEELDVLQLDISNASIRAENYRVILNKNTNAVSVISIAQNYNLYDNITICVGNNNSLWCSLGDYTVNGISVITGNSENVQIFHTGVMPNYSTENNCIEFSVSTRFVTSDYTYIVNNMSGFDGTKLAIDISSFGAFKLLLNKGVQNGEVIAVAMASTYDPAQYALIMTGRREAPYKAPQKLVFSIPVSIDNLSIENKTNQLYNNTYGNSDDIKEFQYTNNDMIWTWWDYPQAIVGTRNNGHLFFGYTDAAGHVGVCEYDPERDTYTKCNLRKNDYVDDHNAGTVIEDENGKLIFLSDGLHGTSNNIHWRKTKKIENPDTFEGDRFLSIGGQCVYTQVHKVGDRWYVFTRKDATSWVYISTTDFETWTSPKTIVTSDVQWYCLFKPVTDESSKLRIAMYSNPTAGDSNIRLAYIDLSDDKIYDGDGATVLGTAGTGVDKNDISVLIAAVSPKKIRLQDLAVTAMDDIVISYYDMEGYADGAQYKVYRNGTIIDTVVSDKPIGFSYHGGQSFIGDNKDKLVVSRYDIDADYDIIETYEYSNGNYEFVKEYHRTRVYWTEGKNIREGRPRTDTSGKYIITHIGYLLFNSDDPNHPSYTEFMTSANVYKIEE